MKHPIILMSAGNNTLQEHYRWMLIKGNAISFRIACTASLPSGLYSMECFSASSFPSASIHLSCSG